MLIIGGLIFTRFFLVAGTVTAAACAPEHPSRRKRMTRAQGTSV
jgi:hypothetical protein